jgi:hypothetical protein
MQLTKEELEVMIKEEIDVMTNEGFFDRLGARAVGLKKGLGSKVKAAAIGAGGKIAGLGGERGKEIAASATQAAGEEREAGVGRAQAAKALFVAERSYKEFVNDLEKLGLADLPEFKRGLSALRTAIKKLKPQAAEE